jgi:hypothetical protein
MKKKHLFCLCLFSVAAALLTVITAGNGEKNGYIPSSRSFAVVECPASVSDRTVVAMLSKNGIENVLSESTQFFFMDMWNGIEQVPLDRLDERLIEGDPRRDSYAQKLRLFFVNDRTRRFFVPLSNWQNKKAFAIEAAVRDSLPGIPVSSIVLPQSTQSPLSQTFGVIEKTALLAALLMLCVLIILPFFKDVLSDVAYRDRKIRRGTLPLIASLFLTAVLVASGIADGRASAFPFVFIVMPLGLFLFVWILPAWFRRTAALRRGHIIFRPVVVRGILPHPKRRGPPKTTPKAVFGLFGIAALALAVSFFAGSNEETTDFSFSNEGYGDIVSEDEYHAHGRHETLLSYLPLWAEREEDAPPYRRYAVDADGLYAATGTNPMPETTIPPYPFEGLAAFDGGAAGLTVATSLDGGFLFFIALAGLLPFVILRTRHEDI